MKKIFAVILSALVLQFSGCRGCGGEGASQSADFGRDAKAFLAAQGIDPSSVRVIGPDAFITYEASQALAYDAQLLVVWGTIFGALAELAPSGTVTIVNTAGGEPATLVRARSADIKAYTQEKIDFDAFMKKVQISPAQ